MGCSYSKKDLLKTDTMERQDVRVELSSKVSIKNARHKLKVLLVGEEKNNLYFQELSNAIDELKFIKYSVKTPQQAVATFSSLLPDIIFFDLRNAPVSEDVIRTFRNVRYPLLIIGVVKDKEIISPGFDRIFFENETNLIPYLSESRSHLSSQEFIKTTLALSESVYIAMDKSRDLVLITDSNSIIQFVNLPFLQSLGYNREELTGKMATQFQNHMDLVPVLEQIEKGLEWVGKIRWTCKNGEMIVLQCRAHPFTPFANLTTHYIYMHDNPLENKIYPPASKLPCFQDLNTMINDDFSRRKRLSTLYSLRLDAPVTKILSLLSGVKESVSPYAQQMVDQAMDILRTTDLYKSQILDNYRDSIVTSVCITEDSPTRSNSATQLKEAMDKLLSWNCDIFSIEYLTGNKPLIHVGMKLFLQFNIHKTLTTDDKTIYCWLLTIERFYKRHNDYHNSTHAADVLQATACFTLKLRKKNLLGPIDEACCLIAATTHDVDHPGRTTSFLINTGDYLAILYNDVSVLEQHHAALTFKLIREDERINIFKRLDKQTFLSVRSTIIDIILATDIYKHFEHFSQFLSVFKQPESFVKYEFGITSGDIKLVKRMLVKCADISNPSRPWHLCKEWAKRLAKEHFSQTDEEKARNLPVSDPNFERETSSIPKSQLEFMNYIVNSTIEEWDAFIDMPEILTNLRANYTCWKNLNEKGITGTDDFERDSSTSSY